MLAGRTSPTSNAYAGDIYVDVGPSFDNYTGAAVATKVGSGTLTFSDGSNGSMSYSVTAGGASNVQQTKVITRFALDPTGRQPVCGYSTFASYKLAKNYQDLWWNPAQSGWGVNFAHQGDQVFATWYTYDTNNAPLWLSALLTRVGTSEQFYGPLIRTSGPRFDNYTPPPANQTVGSMTVTFTSGDDATFDIRTSAVGGLPAAHTNTAITRFIFDAPGGTVCQ
jgi:hypothetical protein